MDDQWRLKAAGQLMAEAGESWRSMKLAGVALA
jgi:hypothetical protein